MTIIRNFDPAIPGGPFNINPRDEDINPVILRQIGDALFSSSDSALARVIFSRQSLNLQGKYIAALENLWESRTNGAGILSKPDDLFNRRLAVCTFLNYIIISNNQSFSPEARDNAEYFLNREEFASERLGLNYGYGEPIVFSDGTQSAVNNFLRNQRSGLRKYPFDSVQRACLEIQSDRGYSEAIYKSISNRTLTPLFSYMNDKKVSTRDYLTASVISLAEIGAYEEAKKLVDMIIKSADPNEPLKEYHPGSWVRPTAYLVNETLNRIVFCCENSSFFEIRKDDMPDSLKDLAKSIKIYLSGTDRLMKKSLSVEAICLEERFKSLDNDLVSYFGFPTGFIYALRFDSRRMNEEGFKKQVSDAIDKRLDKANSPIKERIVSLLLSDLKSVQIAA